MFCFLKVVMENVGEYQALTEGTKFLKLKFLVLSCELYLLGDVAEKNRGVLSRSKII